MPTYSSQPVLGSVAKEFSLPGVDGVTYRLQDFKNAKALVIVFMCNHCPYVKAVQGRINRLAQKFQARGVQLIAINSNDSVKYPEDSFEAMKTTAREQGYVFPYLWDESQKVAKAYGAVCTPEFYAYRPDQGQWLLEYQGRLDDHWQNESQVTREELALALHALLEGHKPNPDQKPAMGCSIKWKQA